MEVFHLYSFSKTGNMRLQRLKVNKYGLTNRGYELGLHVSHIYFELFALITKPINYIYNSQFMKNYLHIYICICILIELREYRNYKNILQETYTIHNILMEII